MKGSCAMLSCLVLLLVSLVTVNCTPAAQARSDEDAWLAVINSGTPQEPAPQARQDTELYQFEQPEGLGVQQPAGRVVQQAGERAAQQPIDIVPQTYDRAPQQQPIERFAQQPVVQQQQQQFQPQVPPQQRAPAPQQRLPPPQQRIPPQQRLPPQQQRVPPQQQRLPQQNPAFRDQVRQVRPGPPRQGQRPGPPRRKPSDPGLIGKITGAVDGVVKGAQCAATNFITDEKMKDEDFIKFQLNCAMGRGPCDEIGNKIKILAPEVLAGRCPRPCNECTRKQIRRVMGELSQKFPGEFQEMLSRLRG